MTDNERMVLILTADLALMSDGYTPLLIIQQMKARLRLARDAVVEADGYRIAREAAKQEAPPKD